VGGRAQVHRDVSSAGVSFAPGRSKQLAALQQTHFWFRGRRRLVDALLRDELLESRRVLDVGCGAGGTLRWLLERGHTATGVDSSAASLEHAAQLVPPTSLHRGDAVALPFPNGSFDGVLLLDVLEHTDDAAALREARRVVRPGGWVLVSAPAYQWLWSFRDVDAGHLRRYSRRRIEEVVRRSGLVVERVTYYQCALFPILAGGRLAMRRRGRSLRDAEERVPPLVNAPLTLLNSIEAYVARRIDLPWGSSLFVRARSPA
jgi:SAM-dependent methyltransferase